MRASSINVPASLLTGFALGLLLVLSATSVAYAEPSPARSQSGTVSARTPNSASVHTEPARSRTDSELGERGHEVSGGGESDTASESAASEELQEAEESEASEELQEPEESEHSDAESGILRNRRS
jgi:hypothetical protein